MKTITVFGVVLINDPDGTYSNDSRRITLCDSGVSVSCNGKTENHEWQKIQEILLCTTVGESEGYGLEESSLPDCLEKACPNCGAVAKDDDGDHLCETCGELDYNEVIRPKLTTANGSQMNKPLNQLRDECYKNSKDHGFHDPPGKSVGDDVALMHSELSELLEDHRNGRKPNEAYYTRKVHAPYGDAMYKLEVPCEKDHPDAKPCGIPSEIADVIVRALDFCGNYGIDIEQAVEEKMAFNRGRPFRHGNKAL